MSSNLTRDAAERHAVFGIRHHGPGSALALGAALAAYDPDILLIEGPPEGSAMIPWLAHPQMVLPAALLIYRPDAPRRAAYYPYTDFSPETEAIRFALARQRPARFADLAQTHQLAAETRPQVPGQEVFQTLTAATGQPNYESWWNVAIEQRRDSAQLFTAVLELMQALRAEADEDAGEEADVLWAQRREAAMRREIRRSLAAGYERAAFVCGAWHAPALLDLSAADEDERLLSGLAAAAVEATWVPWTYGRLAMSSGYGAGIHSPGWYEHLWQRARAGDDVRQIGAGWLARVAGLLREAGFSASPAHIIECVRLAETLAALRGLPFPGLPELNEATVAVLCAGDAGPMQVIRRRLIVGERMGLTPPDTPMTPLQRDLRRRQQELDLLPDPEPRTLKLDLRDERDLARSRLLHRLRLLGVPWGDPGRRRVQQAAGGESWQVQWKPDFAVAVIEAGMWGNSVPEAAAARVRDAAGRTGSLAELTELLDRALPAGLPEAVAAIVARIQDESAVSSDIPLLMDALPPLARVLRYGSERQIDQEVLQQVVDSLLARICIGLPSTCAALDDDAAKRMAAQLGTVTAVVHTLRDEEQMQRWQQALLAVLAQPGLHGLLDGRISRLLLDDDALSADDAAGRMERALRLGASAAITAEEAARSAAWLDGFLQGSELLLVHDRRLWRMLDGFLMQLPPELFVAILPLLRRAFAGYSDAARRQLQERVQQGQDAPPAEMPVYAEFDHERAAAVLPLLADLLGLEDEDGRSS